MNLFDVAVASKLSGGGGGGGSSDFSTAEVTFIDEGGIGEDVFGPILYDGEGDAGIIPYTSTDSGTISIALYKGVAGLYVKNGTDYTFSVSGDITDDGQGYFTITGDGTITIS